MLVRLCVDVQKIIIHGTLCLGEESRACHLLVQLTTQQRERGRARRERDALLALCLKQKKSRHPPRTHHSS